MKVTCFTIVVQSRYIWILTTSFIWGAFGQCFGKRIWIRIEIIAEQFKIHIPYHENL